jgi:hypothetical protein
MVDQNTGRSNGSWATFNGKPVQGSGRKPTPEELQAHIARREARKQRKAGKQAKQQAFNQKRAVKRAQKAEKRREQQSAATRYQADKKAMQQAKKAAMDAENKNLREALKQIQAEKKQLEMKSRDLKKASKAQKEFMNKQFREGMKQLKESAPKSTGAVNRAWQRMKDMSKIKASKAEPMATSDMEAMSQMPMQNYSSDGMPQLYSNEARDNFHNQMEDMSEETSWTGETSWMDYCLLTGIIVIIAYLLYKLFKACRARNEAIENEEEMIQQAIDLSNCPHAHNGMSVVHVPVTQAGQQKVVTITMPSAQAQAVSAVQANAMLTGQSVQRRSTPAAMPQVTVQAL